MGHFYRVEGCAYDNGGHEINKSESEEAGTFQPVVKANFPNDDQPGGTMLVVLGCMPLEVCGPTGEIGYCGNDIFLMEGEKMRFSLVTLILKRVRKSNLVLLSYTNY